MQIDILRGELERLFELPELLDLTRDVMGFDPDQVGGTAGKGSYVKALTDHCIEEDAVEALCDAILASKTEVNPKIAQIGVAGLPFDHDLKPGDQFADLSVLRKLGEGRLGVAYVARKDGADHRLKVLRHEATRDRRGLHRFLTATRLIGGIDHPGLPPGLAAGLFEGHYYVVHKHIEAQPLSARISRTGPMHINEARPLLRLILEPLQELHARRLAHGDLKLDNVALVRASDGSQQIVLLDAASDRLRARARVANGQKELFSTVASYKTVSPEQIRGQVGDSRSDVYSFGAMLYEVLSGKPPFATDSALDAAIRHLTQDPQPPSQVAPRGWITKELDEFILALLQKEPDKRPSNAGALLERIETLGRTQAQAVVQKISEEDLEARIDGLIADPEDNEAAVKLEEAVEQGADPARVAEAITMAADQIEAGDDAKKAEAKKSLLFRAARLYHQGAKDGAKAEGIYVALAELDPDDVIAISALEDIRKELGKYEDLVEMLLERSEKSDSDDERARAMGEIGRLYATELSDSEQALVAYSQAFCVDPENESYPREIEKLAGSSQESWGEVLQTCVEATNNQGLAQELRSAILLKMGAWYGDKVQRADLALPCYQAVVAADPANEAALEGMTNIYRKAQQWAELGMVLSRRADAAATPAKARDLRAEAAEILEHQMNDMGGARDLYEQVLTDDPSHEKASEALGKIYERSGDFAGFVKILETRADALRGDEQHKVQCRIAEIYEDRLGDIVEAERRYRAVHTDDPAYLNAIRGLDRIYSKTAKYGELLEVLEAEIRVAATPRQKITILERIAGIQDEEFLDHAKAAEAFEAILAIDNAHDGALTSLGRHYRALNRWEDVADLYERHIALLTDPPRRIELALERGRVLQEQIGAPDRAMASYETVLQIDPEHAAALEALAHLRETSGDADKALEAIEALADKATTPEAKAEQFLRAAKLLEERGDRDGAIDRYKLALDANPQDRTASAALRAAYAARGDANAALELIDKEIDQTDGDRAKAKLAAEAATLALEQLKDEEKAKTAADRAVSFDPTNLEALRILGDLAFEDKRHLEAAKHYEQLANRADALDKEQASRILVRYVDALSQSGSTEKALAPMDTLLRIAPDDHEALQRVAQVTFEHGSPKRANELYADLLKRFKDKITDDLPIATYRLGESARASGDLKGARAPLEEAADLDPSNRLPLQSLAKLHEAEEKWDDVIKTKDRELDICDGDDRTQLLMEMGEIAADRLKDRTRAAKIFVAALEERPDDRKLLTKLMQLYSEEKDWGKLIDVVLRLAEFVEDKKQKAKYLQTAAIVAGTQMGDVDRALDFYEQVMDLDPEADKALTESIELRRGKGEHEEVEKLLKKKLAKASETKKKDEMLKCFGELGELYNKHLGWTDKAIDAYEAAHTLDPDNKERSELLSELYASDPEKYLDKAVASQMALLRENPYRPESYNLLRRLYTEVKRADPAWCLCQALVVLNLAEPDEERFFNRMRSDTAAAAQDSFTDDDWLSKVMHEDADPLLTSLFALIGRAVLAKRGRSFEELGYDPRYAVDLAQHPYPMSQTLHYAAGVLGMDPPPTFENANDPGGLSFLHAQTPSIVLGTAALSAEVPPQAAAFIAARHLTYFHPGMYIRHLLPSGTGLKAWLFAAIKLIAPQFPVAAQLEGPVKEALEALDKGMEGQRRDQLARIVSKLLEGGGALDLKKWVAAIDLTADRAGLIVCHDLETAAEIIRASDESSSAVPNQDRLKDLVLYSVSEKYFSIRQRLLIAVDQ